MMQKIIFSVVSNLCMGRLLKKSIFFAMSHISNQTITDLRTGSRLAYEALYKEHYTSVERFILKNSGTVDDARDIFQDSLLVLFQKLKADDFELTASLKTYIIAISKNLWFKKLRHISYYAEVKMTEAFSNKFYEEISSSILHEKTYWEKLQTYMDKITAHCNYLLQAMFLKRKSIETIQQEFGYTSVHNAQNQKHKCINQLRKVKEVHELAEVKKIFY